MNHRDHLQLVGGGHKRRDAIDWLIARFARRSDHLLVELLAELGHTSWSGRRAELAQRMLARNLTQLDHARRRLHECIDGLDAHHSPVEVA